ncbi:MAG TPA: hypothetical protein VGG56_13165 [Terracidiphilus sp.]
MKGFRRKRSKPFRDVAPPLVKLKKRPSLLQRHQRLTSVIGALIVFTTFVVKDTLRENLKDKMGDLQSSITLFESTPGRILSSSETEADFESWQGYFGSKPQSPTIEFERKGPLELRKEEFDSEVEKTNATYRSSGELLKQLDGFEELKRDHKALYARLFSVMIDTDKGVVYAIEQNIDHMPEAEANAALKKARQVMYSAGIRISILSGTVFSDAEYVLGRAHYEQQMLESKYKKITILSYFLYALGWTLALVGRLFNVDGLSSDIE